MAFACALLHAAVASGETPSLLRDVMPVLSKAGCNLGKCHGNAQGKGGFKLSRRGVDPAADHRAITRDFSGRRIQPVIPEASLLLRKATMAVAHQGGRRFATEADESRVLRDWIAAGAPGPQRAEAALIALEVTPSSAVIIEPETSLQLSVTARFADGHERNVTQWAVYEPSTNDVAVSPGGLASRLVAGETTVLVRYLELQTPVTLAFIPAREV